VTQMPCDNAMDDVIRLGVVNHLAERFGWYPDDVELVEVRGGAESLSCTFLVKGLGWSWGSADDEVDRCPALDFMAARTGVREWSADAK
jgi:hypothetical protein